jgi:hypothetical protein
MKNIFQLMIWGCFLVMIPGIATAQKFDEERMQRDIQVAENVLGTLIKQQFNSQRSFFPMEIKGSYQAGYGITFTLPADFTTHIVFTMPQGSSNNVIFRDGDIQLNPGSSFSYSYEIEDFPEVPEAPAEPRPTEARASEGRTTRVTGLKGRANNRMNPEMDSIRDAYNAKIIDAAKTFILDYGDMISQLGANEKIVITNQGNHARGWGNQFFSTSKRRLLTVEGTRADVISFRQGKINRDQALSKIKVVNTETVTEVEPDLELLMSMFNRLYRPDLSKTYFTENNIYYERLKDFGAIVYMNVYSSTESRPRRFRMPTLGLDDVDMETRDKKVKELYPKFEQELKENILEYGRTVKSLKDDEVLVFQVKLTKCTSCGIPSTLEYTVKGNVLRDFNSGKIEKNSALSKISLKKGVNQ